MVGTIIKPFNMTSSPKKADSTVTMGTYRPRVFSTSKKDPDTLERLDIPIPETEKPIN